MKKTFLLGQLFELMGSKCCYGIPLSVLISIYFFMKNRITGTIYESSIRRLLPNASLVVEGTLIWNS